MHLNDHNKHTPLAPLAISFSKLPNAHTKSNLLNNPKKLFKEFIALNQTIYWNLNVQEATSLCTWAGYFTPNTLVIEGPLRALNVIKSAWARKLLAAPLEYEISAIGSVMGRLEFQSVEQMGNIPLHEALCFLIFDLTNNDGLCTFDVIYERLRIWHQPFYTLPPKQVVKRTLNFLCDIGEVYVTANGYNMMSQEKKRIAEWICQLPPPKDLDPYTIETSNLSVISQLTSQQSIRHNNNAKNNISVLSRKRNKNESNTNDNNNDTITFRNHRETILNKRNSSLIINISSPSQVNNVAHAPLACSETTSTVSKTASKAPQNTEDIWQKYRMHKDSSSSSKHKEASPNSTGKMCNKLDSGFNDGISSSVKSLHL